VKQRDHLCSTGLEVGLQRLKLPWEKDVPEFNSTFHSTKEVRAKRMESLGLERRDSATASALLAFASSSISLQSAKKAPSRRDVEDWMERKGLKGEYLIKRGY